MRGKVNMFSQICGETSWFTMVQSKNITYNKSKCINTLLKTVPYPLAKGNFELMIFLFRRWDMVAWKEPKIISQLVAKKCHFVTWFRACEFRSQIIFFGKPCPTRMSLRTAVVSSYPCCLSAMTRASCSSSRLPELHWSAISWETWRRPVPVGVHKRRRRMYKACGESSSRDRSTAASLFASSLLVEDVAVWTKP